MSKNLVFWYRVVLAYYFIIHFRPNEADNLGMKLSYYLVLLVIIVDFSIVLYKTMKEQIQKTKK